MATTPQTTYFGDVNVYGNTTMSGTLAVLGTPALFRSNLGVVTDRTSLIGTQATPFQYARVNTGNTTSVNFLTNIPGPIGVGTAETGTQVTVQGNVQVSNSVSTTNVNVVTSINTGSVMNVNFVSGRGGVGIGTNVVGAAALAVLGTMNAVASFQAANLVLSGTLNVAAANLFTLVASNIGVGTVPVTGGATLAIQGFATVSNSISTTNVYVTTANVGTLNTGALVNSTGFFGFGAAAASGTTAYVLGDLRSSNAIAVPTMTSNGLIASGLINVATVVVQSNVGIGTTPVSGGATLAVRGNVFLSNAFTTPQVFADFMNVSSQSNIVTGIATSNVLVGPGADQYKGVNLSVGGNVVISNALQTAGVTSNLINVGTSANLLALVNSFAIGTTTLFPNASMTINGNLYASNTATISTANTTRSNVTQYANAVTITAASNVGIGTTPVNGGAVLAVQGNLFVSTAVTTTAVFATTSANVLTLNTANIFTTSGFLGVGTANPSGTTLYVQGNVYVSNALTTGRIAVTNSNALASNATTIYVSSNVGIGTTPVAGGAALVVQGNAFISNAVTTTNVFATTSANVLTLNTGSIFTTASGFLGIGTSAPSGTSLYLSGNVYASTALATTNVRATLINATGLANTTNFTMGTGQFLGVSTTPTGNALEVSGNSFVSNSISSTNVFSTLANLGTLNTLSIFTRNSFLGLGTSVASGTSLYVPGNVYASTSISAPAIFYSDITAQIVSGNAATVTTGTAGVGGAIGGSTLYVTGNLYASNAVTTTSVTATSANVTGVSNVTSLTQIPALSLGTSAIGAGIGVRGNVVASNSVTTTNVYATSVNTATMNVLSISSPTGVGLTGYSGPWAYTPLNGTLADSIGNLQNPVVTGTLTYTTTNGPGGGPTLVAAPSSYPNWTMSSFINVDDGLSVSLWVKFNAAYSATRDIFSGQTFYNQGLNFAISGSKFQLNFWTKPVPVSSIINTAITPVVGTWYNLACTINKSKLITFYVNGVSVGSATYTNSGTTMGPGIWLNGPTLVSTGEAEYASLQIYTADLTDGEISSIYNLNAARPLTGYAIRVQNNLYASNALTIAGNIAATSMNLTSTLNTGSVTTAVLIANTLGWSNTNIFISNSITTTNVFTKNVNAASYAGSIGINTFDGGYALKIQGNLASSNTLWSLPDVSAPTGIYYVDDITKRSPHLLPTQSNAGLIQNWISTTCNAASQPTDAWWSTSPTPVFGNVATGPPGGGAYQGSVLLPDGRVLFVPYNSSKIGMFNSTTNEYSEIIPTGLTLNAGGAKYSGGVLLPSGNVLFGPLTSNIGTFNPLSLQFSNTSVTGIATNSQVFILNEPTGNVMISHNSGISSYDPRTGGIYLASALTQGSASTLTPTGNILQIYTSGIRYYDPYAKVGTNQFIASEAYRSSSLTLTVNGNVVSIPNNFNAGAGNIHVIKPPPGTTIRTPIFNTTVTGLFAGGILLPTGNIVCVPFNSSNVLMIDPIALTTSNAATVGGSGLGFYGGGTLLPDGRVVFAPYNSMNVGVLSTFTPAPVEFCLSPYFNKY